MSEERLAEFPASGGVELPLIPTPPPTKRPLSSSSIRRTPTLPALEKPVSPQKAVSKKPDSAKKPATPSDSVHMPSPPMSPKTPTRPATPKTPKTSKKPPATLKKTKSKWGSFATGENSQWLSTIVMAVCGMEGQISSHSLFAKIKHAGYRIFDDPRLQPLVERLLNTKDHRSGSSIYLNMRKLFPAEWLEVLPDDCIEIIRKVLFGKTIIPEFERLTQDLRVMYEKVHRNGGGEMPDGLKGADSHWGVGLCTVDGQRWSHGDSRLPRTLQSCMAVLNYALAVTEMGGEHVHGYVGKEATPDGKVNQIRLDKNDLPHNALIQAGAMAITSLFLDKEPSLPAAFDHITDRYSQLAGDVPLKINNTVYLNEKTHSDRKFSIAYYMKEHGVFPDGCRLQNVIDLYFQLCSLEVTCEQGALMAATIANGGTCPVTGRRVLSTTAVQNTLSIMQLHGMYGYSGEWMFEVGIPAKSCRSGLIMVVVPGIMGLCLYSPLLDRHGNSVRGLDFTVRMGRRYALHYLDNQIATTHSKENILNRTEGKDSEEQVIMNVIFAAAHGDMNLLHRYQELGIELTVTDYDGRTALHLAASTDNITCAKYLLETGGVDPHALDRWNRTALDDAIQFGSEELVQLLRSWGTVEGPGLVTSVE